MCPTPQAAICEALNDTKQERILDILTAEYADADVVCLQEVAAVFADRAALRPQLKARYHFLLPAELDGKRDQNSIILLAKRRFSDEAVAAAEEVTAAIAARCAPPRTLARVASSTGGPRTGQDRRPEAAGRGRPLRGLRRRPAARLLPRRHRRRGHPPHDRGAAGPRRGPRGRTPECSAWAGQAMVDFATAERPDFRVVAGIDANTYGPQYLATILDSRNVTITSDNDRRPGGADTGAAADAENAGPKMCDLAAFGARPSRPPAASGARLSRRECSR